MIYGEFSKKVTAKIKIHDCATKQFELDTTYHQNIYLICISKFVI